MNKFFIILAYDEKFWSSYSPKDAFSDDFSLIACALSPYSSQHPPSPRIFQMSLSDCTDTLKPFARLFSLSLFTVIYAHYFSPCVCAFPCLTNRTGTSEIFLALPLGELSAGLRGENPRNPIGKNHSLSIHHYLSKFREFLIYVAVAVDKSEKLV